MYQTNPFFIPPMPYYAPYSYCYLSGSNSWQMSTTFSKFENRTTKDQVQVKVQKSKEDEIRILQPSNQSEEQASNVSPSQPEKVSTEVIRKIKSKKRKASKNRKAAQTAKQRLLLKHTGRNCHSNIMRMFFRRLEVKINVSSTIRNIIDKNNMQISFEQFESWYSKNRIEYRNYIKVSTIRRLFKKVQFIEEQTMIMRILLKQFIQNEAMVCNLTSKKAKKEVVRCNMKSLRLIIGDILA